MSNKFKPGDRVVCTEECEFVEKGATGTIQKQVGDLEYAFWVVWDDYNMILESSDNCWAKPIYDIKLITEKENTMTPEEIINKLHT
jgi:hypothetical protein